MTPIIPEFVVGIAIGVVGTNALLFGTRFVWRRWLRDWCLRP